MSSLALQKGQHVRSHKQAVVPFEVILVNLFLLQNVLTPGLLATDL